MKDGNGVIDEKRLREILAKRKGKKLLKDLAPELGVSIQFLAAVLTGNYAPGPRIAAALGYDQVVMFRRTPSRKTAGASPRKRGKK